MQFEIWFDECSQTVHFESVAGVLELIVTPYGRIRSMAAKPQVGDMFIQLE